MRPDGLRICFLSYRGLPRSPNSAAYKRVERLSRRHSLTVVTPKDAFLPEAVLETAHVRRTAFAPASALGDLGHAIRLVLFAVQCVVTLLRLRRRGLDIVYTFHTPECCIGWAFRALRVRWVVDVLDLPYILAADATTGGGFRGPISRRLVAGMIKLVIRRADLVITTAIDENHGFARTLVGEYSVPVGRLLAVPNGVDLSIVKPDGPAVRHSGFTVFYVGFVSPRRGVDILIRACEVVAAQTQGLRLVLVGPAKPEDERFIEQERRIARSLKLEYLGSQPHERVLELIRGADVCVYPFPRTPVLDGVLAIKVAEYLACGRPVVATRLEGTKALLRDGINGLLVEPDSVHAMASAIDRLRRDDDLRARLVLNARESVLWLDWEKILDQIEVRMTGLSRGRR